MFGDFVDFRGEVIEALGRSAVRAKATLVVVAAGSTHEIAVLREALPEAVVIPAHSGASDASLRRSGMSGFESDVYRFVSCREASSLVAGIAVLTGTDAPRPAACVIVPVANAAIELQRTGPALAAGTRALGAQLMMVDDASTDASAEVAAECADVLIRLRGQHRGPAYARNRGAELSDATVLTFVDADVLVHRATLEELLRTFEQRPDVSAVFGSFDNGPPGTGFVGRYRNLLAHELHECLAGDVGIFWAACGAVRRSAFDSVGGFDEWRFTSAEVESVELGQRLRRAGHRMLLRPELQVTHLRDYSLGSLIRGDLRQFVVPLYRVAHDGGLPRVEFPVRIEKRASMLVVGGLASAIAGLVDPRHASLWWTLAVALPAGAAVLRWPLYAFFARQAGPLFMLAAIPLHQAHATATALASLAGRLLGMLFGEPRPDALTEAFAEVGVRKWPPLPKRPAASADRS